MDSRSAFERGTVALWNRPEAGMPFASCPDVEHRSVRFVMMPIGGPIDGADHWQLLSDSSFDQGAKSDE
jgi:hypothetical protein